VGALARKLNAGQQHYLQEATRTFDGWAWGSFELRPLVIETEVIVGQE
jgi:hypothetical protein